MLTEEEMFLKEGVDELKTQMRFLVKGQEDILAEVKRTNGRVTKLEQSDTEQRIKAARAEGIAQAKQGVVITGRQITTFGGALGIVVTLVEVAIKYFGS